MFTSSTPYKGFGALAVAFYKSKIIRQIVVTTALAFIVLIIARVFYVALAPPETIEESIEVSLEALKKSSITLDTRNRGTGVWYNFTVRSAKAIPSLLQEAKLPQEEIDTLLQLPLVAKFLPKAKRGKTELRVLRSFEGRLLVLQLILDKTQENMLEVRQIDNNINAAIVARPIDIQDQYASIKIRESLFTDSDRAGVPRSVVRQLYSIFAWDIDFSNEIHKGDQFSLLYEKVYREGIHESNGLIKAAIYLPASSKRSSLKAVYFKPKDARTGEYYDPKGRSVKKNFLRSPVDPNASRISSRYSGNRFHPVLKRWRAHRGIDFAAPTGTPIYATGAGTVSYKGYNGAYGNMIRIKHSSRYTTLYAHMQRYARGMRVGKKVKQRQIIGYVGSTGLATGPHVHYEFQIHKKAVNPSRVKLRHGANIGDTLRPAFNTVASETLKLLTLNVENEKSKGATQGGALQ